MKKLLLQTAITALVSTGVASNVMADAEAVGNARIGLKGKEITPISVSETAKPYDILLQVDSSKVANAADFATAIGDTSKSINTIYHTASPTINSIGCITFEHIDKTISGGGVQSIVVGNSMSLGNNLAIPTATVDLYIEDGGTCATAKTELPTPTIAPAGLPDALKTIGVTTGSTKKPQNDTIAIWYQLPSTALDLVKISEITAPTYAKGGSFDGQLKFTLTPASN